MSQSVAGLTTDAALRQAFTNSLPGQSVRHDELVFAVDSLAWQVTITPTEDSPTYLGTLVWPYRKVSLASVVPEPLLVHGPWPITYGRLADTLMAQYGLLLEPGDVSLSAGGTVLKDTDWLPTGLSENDPILTLYATRQSGRFIADSVLRLRIKATNRPMPLPWLVGHGRLSLSALSDVASGRIGQAYS